jgi:hypothetical protein
LPNFDRRTNQSAKPGVLDSATNGPDELPV